MPDIASNLAVHLKFENNGLDSSGNGRNFSLVGTMPFITGHVGNACTPTSTNYWTISSPTWWNSLNAWSVSAWVRDTSYVSGQAAFSFGTAVAGGSIVCYPYEFLNGGGLRVFSKTDFIFDLGANKPALNSWQHIVLVCESSSSAKAYVNGELEGTNTVMNFSTAAAQTTVRVGMYHNGAQSYSGGIDEFRMYTRALTLDDVRLLYTASAVNGDRNPSELGVGISLGI